MNFFNLFSSIFMCTLLYSCRSEEECMNVDEDGACLERCSEDMFLFVSSCDNETLSQRTCRQPVAKSLGNICDFTRCECNDSKLWDEAAKKCVISEECSDQSKVVDE